MLYLIFFIIVIIAELLNIGFLIITLSFSNIRLWPPHSHKCWNFYFICVLNDIGEIGIILVGILDWNSFLIKSFIRLPFGLVLSVVGYWFFHKSSKTLNLYSYSNGDDSLVTEGFYRYSRNPQYFCAILIIIGIILITNSFGSFIIGFVAIVWFVMAVFLEESSLKQKYGQEYTEYCRNVRRFL